MQVQDQPNAGRRLHQSTALLMLVLVLLSGCGRAEQQADQSSPAPLSPAPATPETTTPTSAAQGTPVLIRPTPNGTQLAASMTVALIQTGGAEWRNTRYATATAEAAWAQTPEPTILPPADTPRLRDQWPATAQQAAAPTRLYLRSFDVDLREPDTFWEVRLPDAQVRRLPAVEQDSIDQSAQVSPDGRYLAYVTGNASAMERTLRVLDLTQDTDLDTAVPVTDSVTRCSLPFAWSSDGASLAAISISENKSGPMAHLQLYDDIGAGQVSRTLVTLPYFLDLIGWLDTEHLLVSQWKPSTRPNQLLSVDRQGHVVVITELQPARLSCASLSPDGQNLIYVSASHIKRLQFRTGQEETFSTLPSELFWVGDGHALLISRLGTDRRIWLRSLDQPQKQSQGQSSIFLSPPYQAAYKFSVIGVSPDNRTLVACELAPHDNPRIRTSESRTWLYHIPDDRWTLVHTNPGGACDLVLGWSSVGGGR